MEKHNHYFYVLKCADGSLYAGYTNDLQKRLSTHNNGKGAKYTRARRPVELHYHECFSTKTEAMQQEYRFKTWTRKKKDLYIEAMRMEEKKEAAHENTEKL
ncbi:GIY-YIG nuclease family protein [Bacillus pumilus]|uniref:GIY-YIG nuclease family protein n=1 Tax=Bacillus pumilus TaxID=1408 RepID=UPI0011E96FAF|nr:GIY-YIG nuclease family protein [Bacillus pumilus]TYS30129.1 GIY-YIG nuclease family protein [Bacillus pumilus]TYS43033.1 GIY-YIG nuclease family protein [Bacillus pumilus]